MGRREPQIPQYTLIEVTITPITWIVAPHLSEEQLMRYAERGWIDVELAKHLDRAFPRDYRGQPIIFKHWLESPIVRACVKLGYEKRIGRNWEIIDDKGFPINYVVIPEKPLVYRRAVLTERSTMEVFEYIDSTYTLKFLAKVPTANAKKWCEAINYSGRIGLLSRTKKGFGKYKVELKIKS